MISEEQDIIFNKGSLENPAARPVEPPEQRERYQDVSVKLIYYSVVL